MPARDITGSDFVWFAYDKYRKIDPPGIEYANFQSLTSENWLNAPLNFDPDSFYQVSYRSSEGSRISARQHIWDTGGHDSFNVVYSNGDRLNIDGNREFYQQPRGGNYFDTERASLSFVFKGFGEKSNPLDDTTINFQVTANRTYTGVAPSLNSPAGRSTFTEKSIERVFFSNAESLLSFTARADRVEEQNAYEFDRQNGGATVSTNLTYTVNNYNFVDKADGFKLSMSEFKYREVSTASTGDYFFSARNAKVTTEDFVLTGGFIPERKLVDTELQRLETVSILPSDRENMAAVRGSMDDFFVPFILSGNNVVTVTSPDGFVFDAGAGNDKITGNVGDDMLIGGAGNDTLIGGAGDDVLQGGIGRDRLTGGAGEDIFRFAGLSEMGLGGLRDIITDFTVGQDLVNLSGFDATPLAGTLNDRFTFLTDAQYASATTALGCIWITKPLANTTVQVINLSTNLDKVAEYQIYVTLSGTNPPQLTADSFIL